MISRILVVACAAGLLAACGAQEQGARKRSASSQFNVTEVAKFNQPWAMTFLPDGRLLVTEKQGALKLYTIGGTVQDIAGIPNVVSEGQAGLGDVVLHPKYEENQWIYLSYAEAGDGDTSGAAVARARLALNESGGALEDLKVIWRQIPKVPGYGHYGHRLAFDSAGFLWITSGERQKFDPAQDMQSNLGKVVRLNEDGSVPKDNPFADQGEVAAQVWSLGHRNPLGIAFDAQSRPWVHEMGPQGGDELNLIVHGGNYGYPVVSQGDHYGGKEIPDHETRPEFIEPVISWNPVISPSGFVIYSGAEFPEWRGNGFIGGLSSQALIRVEFDGTTAREAERFDMGARIREVEQGPDGALWVLENEQKGPGGRLLKLTARDK